MTIFHVLKYDPETFVEMHRTSAKPWTKLLPREISSELIRCWYESEVPLVDAEFLRKVLLEYEGPL